MNVIHLIIVYGMICCCMIIFNVCAIIYSKENYKANVTKIENYHKKIKEQLNRLSEDNSIEPSHLKFLKRKLKKGNELFIFDTVISRYKRGDNKYIDKYIKKCSEVLLNLIYTYNKKSNTEMAYYLSVVREYNLLDNNRSKEILNILINQLTDENFYCRDNSFLAICKLGDSSSLYKALIIINNSNKFYHRNLIFNGLSIYNGNREELIKLLIKKFDEFKTNIKCCIIEYLSFYRVEEYKKFIYSIILEHNARSLKLSAIKYFEFVYYKEAEILLITYVNKYIESNLGDLGFCVACIKALRNYTSEKSIDTIKKAIYVDNLKIRNMACESLAVIRLGIDPGDLEDSTLEDEINEMYNYHIKKNIKKVVN